MAETRLGRKSAVLFFCRMSRNPVRGRKNGNSFGSVYTRVFFCAIFLCSLKKINPQWSVQCKCWLTFPNSLRPGVESWVLFVSPTEHTALPRKCLLERRFESLAAKIQRSRCTLAFPPLERVLERERKRIIFAWSIRL